MTRYLPFLAFSSALLACCVAFAQQQPPHVGYVFPAGGQQGRTFEVRVGGQYLDNIDAAHISGSGVSVKIVELIKPMNQMQVNQLREKLTALQQKKNPSAVAAAKPAAKPADKPAAKPENKPAEKPAAKSTAAAASKPAEKPPAKPAAAPAAKPIMLSAEEEQMIVDIRKKLAKFAAKPPIPAIAQTAVLQVTVAANAPPGVRELRLQTPAGISNPLVFEIGSLGEVVNRPPDDDDVPPRVPLRQLRAQGPGPAAAQPAVDIQLPTEVNGQILAGQVDRYRFSAKKGQHLVMAVSAQQLMPFIADAVPGWFQAAVALRDERGDEVAAAGSFRFHPDPVLDYVVPRDGRYVAEIHDSVFRGRDDFIYRMAIGELPYVTSVFPLGGKTGAVTPVSLDGWNLSAAGLRADARSMPSGIGRLTGVPFAGLTGELPFALDALPEILEQEPNDSPEQAQKVALPIVVNGRVDRPGDRDVFRFEGKAGQTIVAEVYARRLGSPLDSALKLTDSGGRELAFNDDHEDPACGTITHHADSWLTAKLPAAGTYFLHLYDAQQQGGPEYGYRLRIGPSQPDFDLRIVPSGVTVRQTGTAPIVVTALRREGFNGPIQLELKNAPAGCRLSGATIPAGQQKVRCTVTVPAVADQSFVALHMVGRATVQGREILHEAVPADDMMQAFYYHHLVPAKEWLVATVGRSAANFALGDTQGVKLPSGGTAVVHFIGPHGPFVKTVQFTLSEPPEGLSIQKTAFTDVGMDVTFRADAAKLKPGWKGNAIIEASVVRQPDPQPNQPNPPKRRVSLGVLPAVSLEVVAPPSPAPSRGKK